MPAPIDPDSFAAFQRQMKEMQEKMQELQDQLEAQRQALLNRIPVLDILMKTQKAQGAESANRRVQALDRGRKFDVALAIGTTAKVMGKGALILAAKEAAKAAGKEAAKIAAKEAAKAASKEAAKVASKEAAKAAEKRIAKFIPGVSLLLGFCLAIGRYKKGDDWKLAVAEVASGAAACFPGPGYVLSFAIDAGLIVGDIMGNDSANTSSPASEQVAVPDLRTAYLCLGIELEPQEKPTKEEVDRCFRVMTGYFHPDKVQDLGLGAAEIEHTVAQKILQYSRDLIYRDRGWR